MLNVPDTDLPIGVFDSGMGGLTVLAALQRAMPRETFIFLGDTARLPYGTKSADTVRRYAVRAATHLVKLGIKALVVACNTASAAALPRLTAEFAPLPVFGVIEPGALAHDIKWNEQGLVPVITQDWQSGEVLMLAWMNREALLQTLAEGRVIYWSRSRGKLWRKGESSGHVQRLVDLTIDCDGDTLLLAVAQTGPACHTGKQSCFFRAPRAGAIRDILSTPAAN